LPVFQNALDEDAHGPFRRVLAAHDREAQALLPRSLLQHERVERAHRRLGPSGQRAERRAVALRELPVPPQVHRRHVAFGARRHLRLRRRRRRRRYVHDRLSVSVVLLHGRRRAGDGRGGGGGVVVVHGRLRHSQLAAAVRPARVFAGRLLLPPDHQQLHRAVPVVQQTVGLGRVQPGQTTAVHVYYLIADFQIARSRTGRDFS